MTEFYHGKCIGMILFYLNHIGIMSKTQKIYDTMNTISIAVMVSIGFLLFLSRVVFLFVCELSP